MAASLENSAEEIKRLQRCINDLVRVFAPAATWTDAEPSQVVAAVTDALLRMLDLDLVFMRLTTSAGKTPIKIIRFGPSQNSTIEPHMVGEKIDGWFGDNALKWPPLVQIAIGGQDISIAPLQLGLQGERTFIAVGSQRPDFPSQTERLLFSVAANQVAIGLQKAQLLSEQKRIADEVDQRVAERTGEFAAENEELRNEVAERKRAEETLAASERDLSLIINTVPGLAWSIQSDGHIEFLSQNFLDYLGLTLAQVQKFGWAFPVHPDDMEGFVRRLESILASGSVGEVEARIRRFDGEFRWFLCRAAPLRDHSDRVVKWFGINLDVEDRKRAEEELRDTQSKLAHMTRLMSMGQLTASIAHEVNQPLAGIITNANTCLRMLAVSPPNIEGARETARRTIRDGNRASEVIKRLRALFCKREPALEPVDLNEAAREVIALSLGNLQANRVILRTELAEDLPSVNGDRVQLQQVILNLIQNGADAMSEIDDRPREMLIKTERDGPEVLCLTVQDVGIGLAVESGERLFDAFYTTKANGMGIGLSVSRSIIESHGGRMRSTANKGPGVSFSFSVPVLERRIGADATASGAIPRASVKVTDS
jgi:PAS domain S-box-containing protein